MKYDAKPGDIVQIDPENEINPMFGACMMTVTDVKEWGVMGYVQSLGELGTIGGQAYIRLAWDKIEPTGGRCVWGLLEEGEDSEGNQDA